MKKTMGLTLLLCLLALFLFSCGDRTLDIPTDSGVSTIDLRVAVDSDTPTARDFLTDELREWCLEREVHVYFEETPDFTVTGEREVVLVLNQNGRTHRLRAHMTVVQDTTPPTLIGVKELSVRVGEGLILREGVSAADDCFGTVEWTVDASSVDTSCEGIYSATYRAVDASGNATEQTVYVHVYAEEITEAMLWEKLDPVIQGLYAQEASTEQKCRAIHAYVQGAIDYFPISDKTDPVRAAYRALFVKGRGDCYSYFASAMMMLRRAGIEYLEIERTHAAGEETHFWLMVNLAPRGETPRWYHFDPTVIEGGGAAGQGCLFTDAQLDAYNRIDPGFYDYDRGAYPPTATETITE
ncbi:MAG: hypothetical protein E7625_07985 [Ruminococcaceae bacterium]|nr:hypothetical protein [Oscillospiraceae bacterium]